MKSQLFSLALLSGVAATGLLDADYGSCCPQECCTPEPKKCIDCECYTPAYYDLQCDCGIFLSVDFLYWYARESALNYVYRGEAITQPPFDSFPLYRESKNFGTDWEPGVRGGIGYNSRCDGWDVFFHWTYMTNDRSDSISVQTPNFIFPSWSHVSLPIDPNDSASTSLSAKWELTFNQADLELGRKYWLSRCFSLRPYTGLRGAWIKTTLSYQGELTPEGQTSTFLKDTITNTTWAVGFLTGIQPNWHFCSNFILYSNLEVALLWGEFENKESGGISGANLPTEVSELVATNTKLNPFGMHTAIDLGIGIRWEENWCCDRYKTSLDLGWEHHIWLGYNQRQEPISMTGGISSSSATRTDLMMGGLVIRARFDF